MRSAWLSVAVLAASSVYLTEAIAQSGGPDPVAEAKRIAEEEASFMKLFGDLKRREAEAAEAKKAVTAERKRKAEVAEWAKAVRQRQAKRRAEREQRAKIAAVLARAAEQRKRNEAAAAATAERQRLAKEQADREQRAKIAAVLARAAEQRKRNEAAAAERARVAGLARSSKAGRSQSAATTCVDAFQAIVAENPIQFAFASSTLSRSSFRVLRQIAERAGACPTVKFVIEGHTDNVGPVDANQIMSQERAEAVFLYLARRGVARSRMQVKGYGPAKPIASNDTREGRALNRRIAFAPLTQ